MASLTGKEIGKYHIGERIGQGGMAEVYMGVHAHLDRQVAIKVLHGHLLESGDFLARFKREAKAVANLRHPNIVQVYDFDVQDEIIFMVMEYIDGTDLQSKLVALDKKGERLSIKQIGSIIKDIAGALDYAHSKEMLHRDVKPSNILLDKNDKAYLTDFGIARLLSDQKFTATGTLIGTPAYMSPEQGMGEEVSRESDIYSLGVVAFELITGQVPYDAQTPIAIVQKQITDPIPDISKLMDDVPETAQAVIDTALAKSPQSRYPSAEALVAALRGALQALETADLPATKSSHSESKEEDALRAPTVAMKEPDMEQPTVLMEDAEQAESVEEPDLVTESVPEDKEIPGVVQDGGVKKPSFFSSTRNRILAGVGGIIVIAAIVLGTQSLGNTPLSPDQPQSTEPIAQPAQPDDEMSGEVHFEEALQSMEQVRWARAIEQLDLAIAAGFEIPEVYGVRAEAHHKLGHLIPAIDDFTRALELNENIFEYWRERGIVRSELGNFGEALADLTHGLELNTVDPIGYRARARVHIAMDQVEAAIEDALQAARNEPDNFENYLVLIEVYRIHGSPPHQAEEAMGMLEFANEIDPMNPEIHLLRGEIFWFEFGDEVNAQREYDLAVEHGGPTWTAGVDRRGFFYSQTGRCELAIEDFSRYIEIDAENPYIFMGRGECAAELGALDLARADIIKVIIQTTGLPELSDLHQSAKEWLDSHPE